MTRVCLVTYHGLVRWRNAELGRDPDTGGQTRYVLDLAAALGRHPSVEIVEIITPAFEAPGLSVEYASPSVMAVADKISIVRLGEPIRYAAKDRLPDPTGQFATDLWYHLKKYRGSQVIVHGHYYDAGVGVLAATTWDFNCEVRWTPHSLGRGRINASTSQVAVSRDDRELRCLEDSWYTIVNSQFERRLIASNYNIESFAPVVAIPPGVDTKRFYAYSDTINKTPEHVIENIKTQLYRQLSSCGRPWIVTACRPMFYKGLLNLLHSYATQPGVNRVADLVMVIGPRVWPTVRDPESRDVLRQILEYVDAYDLRDRVAILFVKDSDYDTAEVMRMAADNGGIFCNPAGYEPFGLTTLEAASVGLPVLVSENSGSAEVVTRLGCGLLFKSTADLTEQLCRMLAASKECAWRNMSVAGVVGVRGHYTWNHYCEKYLSLEW